MRMPKAYPVYDPNYQASLATISSYLATIRNLQTVGRNGSTATTTRIIRCLPASMLRETSPERRTMSVGQYGNGLPRNGVLILSLVWVQVGLNGDRLVPVPAVAGITPDALIEQVSRSSTRLLGTAVGLVSGLALHRLGVAFC